MKNTWQLDHIETFVFICLQWDDLTGDGTRTYASLLYAYKVETV